MGTSTEDKGQSSFTLCWCQHQIDVVCNIITVMICLLNQILKLFNENILKNKMDSCKFYHAIKKIHFYFICISVLFEHMYEHHVRAWFHGGQKRKLSSLGMELAGCGSPHGCWEPSLLWKRVLHSEEPSPIPAPLPCHSISNGKRKTLGLGK